MYRIDAEALRQIRLQRPDAYLHEIAKELSVSPSGIYRALRRLGISRKKTNLYQERDEVERTTFQSVVAQIPPEHIIWVDETGIEEQMHRPYTREIIGKRAFSNISGKHVPRTTLIAGYVQGRLTAPMYFKGKTDTEMFNLWIENMLLPELKPHHVVVMDNATYLLL